MERRITTQLYQEAKASKLLEFKELFTILESWRYFPAMYRSLQVRMPPLVSRNILSSHPEIKSAVSRWNKENAQYTQTELTVQDSRVQNYILTQFSNAYEHFSIPVNQTEETYTQIHTRVHQQLGLNSQVNTRIEAYCNAKTGYNSLT
jgi:hypothetical protein